jgi:hypothetical protein
MDDPRALTERIVQLERERSEEIARANAALAAAQDRSYWLERWHLDLNALMRRRGAIQLFAAVRALLGLARSVRTAGTGVAQRLDGARRVLGYERRRSEVAQAHTEAGPPPGRATARLEVSPGQDPEQALGRLAELHDELASGARLELAVAAGALDAAQVAARATPEWHVALYRPGDPEVYVLERR